MDSVSARANLLDPVTWQDALMRFATATKLAVLLTDHEGRAVAECVNARPTWSMLRNKKPVRPRDCPFCIQTSESRSTCIADALKEGSTLVTRDPAGLIHLTIPLILFGKPVGAVLAGQVFDRYPNHLTLYKLASKLAISSQKLWLCARLEQPIRREILQNYGSVLEIFSSAFLRSQYQVVMDADRLAEMTRLPDLSSQLAVTEHELASERERQNDVIAGILGDTRRELMAVTARLVKAQEEERRRMSAEIHDSIGQSIVAVLYDMDAFQNRLPRKVRQELRPRFEELRNHIKQLVDEVRQLSHQLHPAILANLGLEEATRQLCRALQAKHSMKLEFVSRDIPERLDPTISLNVYRIIQEALQNVTRHAGPARVTITLLGTETGLTLCIADTGKGFDPDKVKGGLGLINMAARAELIGGVLRVESREGEGTKLLLTLDFRHEMQLQRST